MSGGWTVGDFDPTGGYDCLFAGIRVGPIVVDGSEYGQESMEEASPSVRAKMERDARLIAAAPDLLAIAERIEAAMDFDASGHPMFDGMQAQLLAAIAKATQP